MVTLSVEEKGVARARPSPRPSPGGRGGPAPREASGTIAVLALQGDFAAHRRALADLGRDSFEARNPEELDGAAGLVIPGGESTTLWKFFERAPWESAISRFAASGRPILGTCAGAIVLARDVTNPDQRGLGLIDIGIERNAFGRQLASYVGEVDAPELGGRLPAVFIRAPRIRRVGKDVEVLGRLPADGEPALVRQGAIVAATFHPELTGDPRIHRLVFVDQPKAQEAHA
jgi:5'-phosphate synthase pdxT subunit